MKKKIIVTASAVALAAVMAVGGTLAYYQSQAEYPVENTLVDQGNSVYISESDVDSDEDKQSNTYSIIPGTTDFKDPVVTAEYTLDSYVYVKVDDTTGDLITWNPVSAWTELDGYDNVYYLLLETIKYETGSSDWTDGTGSGIYTYTGTTETGYTYTYDSSSETYTVKSGEVELYAYKVADTDTTTGNVIDVYTAEIHVMAEDTISYSSSITNDTYAGYGQTVSLDFTASIIQAWLGGTDPYGESVYADADVAYAVMATGLNTSPVVVTGSGQGGAVTAFDLQTAINNAGEEATLIILTESVSVTESSEAITVGENQNITISMTDDVLIQSNVKGVPAIGNSGTLTMVGGTLDATQHATAAVSNAAGATMTLIGVTVDRSNEAGASSTNNGGNSYYYIYNEGNLTLEDCVVTSEGKYSSLIENNHTNAVLTIESGTYSGGINTIKNDVGTLVINGGSFSNNMQHVLLNYGTAIINDGAFEITRSGTGYTCVYNYYYDSSTAATVTINGGTFTSLNGPAVYNKGGTVNITDGTFVSTKNAGQVVSNYNSTAYLTISGGTFSGYKTRAIYCASKSTTVVTGGTYSATPITAGSGTATVGTVTQNADGTYTVTTGSTD